MAVNRDVPTNIHPDAPDSQKWAFVNQNFQTLSNNLNPFIVSDGTNNRILLGKKPDGTYGLQVSQSGYEVTTATASQMIFDSNYDLFKIASSGTATLTTVGGQDAKSTTIAHGLGITPAAIVFANPPPASDFAPFSNIYPTIGSGYVNVPFIQSVIQSVDKDGAHSAVSVTTNLFYISYEVDSTNLTLRAQCFVGGGSVDDHTVDYKYYILQETAN